MICSSVNLFFTSNLLSSGLDSSVSRYSNPGGRRSARKATRPRRVDLYEVFCAVLYLLRTGCQWRALPSDFPTWRTVHSYFVIWSQAREGASLLEQALKKSGWRGPRETGAQRLMKSP